jgi:prepilin-type N-terminal cleavage/methylation domain-containing protein
MSCRQQASRQRGAFTLVELAVVIVIIGVLAAFGVPRFLKAVERSKAGEAFAYLSAVRSAQERYQTRQGTYTTDLTQLDIEQVPPKYFTVGAVTATENTWTLTLTRKAGSSGYGAYTVVFDQDGFDTLNSTIAALPDINPMGS